METHDFSNAKVGDKVTCLVYGKGTITNIYVESSYNLLVRFDSGMADYYTTDGKYHLSANSSLYHNHVEFKIEVIEPCPYKVGEMIAAYNSDRWEIVEYHHMEGDILITSNKRRYAQHRKLSSFNIDKNHQDH